MAFEGKGLPPALVTALAAEHHERMAQIRQRLCCMDPAPVASRSMFRAEASEAAATHPLPKGCDRRLINVDDHRRRAVSTRIGSSNLPL